MYRTRVGVDLAKEVIQVCIYRNNKVLSNSEMTPNEFLCWLVNAKPVTIIFEACGTSNYWKQKATNAGHDARLISVKLVSTVRQNQKTDKNDALAIVQAASLPDVTNELSAECRAAIFTEKEHLKVLIKAVHRYDDCLDKPVIADADCKKLLKLEGVGTMNAINLYIALGCAELGVFTKGKDASACIGLTPIQHSSGGGKLGSIGKHCKNSILRSQLVCGAMAAVSQAVKREAKTKKDVWIKGLVERRGNNCFCDANSRYRI